jgi:hypothetical protein
MSNDCAARRATRRRKARGAQVSRFVTESYDWRIMKCPHCLVEFHDQQTWSSLFLGADAGGQWLLSRRVCPACNRFVLYLENGSGTSGPNSFGGQGIRFATVLSTLLVWPKGVSRAPVSSEVPKEIVEDYKEACLVFFDSPKASAALSRRCLQLLLRTAAAVKPGDLSNEIQEVLDSKSLPSALAESIDSVRVVGNFAAHPIKSKSTGEVVPVEPHEAEWNLDVLESLFDFYFVLPARIKAKRDALNKKAGDAGKPPVR